jgi:hypothetical protein
MSYNNNGWQPHYGNYYGAYPAASTPSYPPSAFNAYPAPRPTQAPPTAIKPFLATEFDPYAASVKAPTPTQVAARKSAAAKAQAASEVNPPTSQKKSFQND